MRLADWLFTLLPIALALGMAVYTRRYMRSVSQFMSGGRVAGRYLISIAGGELQAGAAVFAASFEIIGQSGFTLTWWRYVNALVAVMLAVTGFVIFRYRETRSLTLAQFFEIRYSKSFRFFTGILGFIAGILNFGIIPAIGARFLVYFLGLPSSLTVLSLSFPTYVLLMALFLSIACFITLTSGAITLLVANGIEGIFSQLFYIAIIGALLWMFSWKQVEQVFLRQPHGQSFLNPFDCSGFQDFNLVYVLMSIFVGVYGTMAWQNASAYNAAAASPHETRMAKVLGVWREMGKGAVITLLGLCALVFLGHPDFAAQAAPVHAEIDRITDPHVQEQMRIPLAVSQMLPAGVKGMFCAILLMGIFGGDATHLHSWGTIFVQDVLLPLQKKPMSPKEHIRLLRFAIIGVALFAFLFGALFRQTEYIIMWWSVTTAVYVGGAGAAIIGGLYWKKGTTAGAWAGLLAGCILSGGGIVLRGVYGTRFPLNGMEVSFGATLVAIALYVGVSLLTNVEDFNMDRMLHRGVYADTAPDIPRSVADHKVSWLAKLAGFDSNFTILDRWIAGTGVGWNLIFFVIFAAGSLWNLLSVWPDSAWSIYWEITGIWLPVALAVVTGVWLSWGGIRDMPSLFRNLRAQKVSPLDDGTVVEHHNLDENPGSEKKEPQLVR